MRSTAFFTSLIVDFSSIFSPGRFGPKNPRFQNSHTNSYRQIAKLQ